MSKQKNVPELRFPEFTIEEWQEKPLLKLLENVIDYRGKAPPKSEEGVVLITARNVKQGFLDFTTKEFIPYEYYTGWMNRGIPQKGDILFTTEAPLGNVCMFPEDNNIYALGQRTLTLRAKNKVNNGKFLFYLLQSPKGQLKILNRGTGSTAKGIKSSVFKKISFQVPILEEQEKIANFLSAVDKKLTQLRRKKELLETYKRGLMQKLFSQQIRFKQDDGKAFPDWEEKSLGSLGNFIGGGTPDSNKREYWNGTIPWISSSDIEDDSIHKISITRFINEKAIKESATKVVPVGSILIVSRVGVGKLAISNKSLCTSQDFSNFTPTKGNVYFLAYALNSNKNKLLSLSQGTSIKGFTIDDINLFKINIPYIV
jgi:type I restriction enzyme S subunit